MTPEGLAASGTEHGEQAALFCALGELCGQFPEAALAFAIPNGGLRHKATAGRLRAEGVKAGIPDIFVPVARGGYHGLFIEFKPIKLRPKKAGSKGAASDKQSKWIGKLRGQGYGACVCYGWIEARDVIISYLEQ